MLIYLFLYTEIISTKYYRSKVNYIESNRIVS